MHRNSAIHHTLGQRIPAIERRERMIALQAAEKLHLSLTKYRKSYQTGAGFLLSEALFRLFKMVCVATVNRIITPPRIAHLPGVSPRIRKTHTGFSKGSTKPIMLASKERTPPT